MASAIYPLAKQSMLSQSPSIDFDADTLKCVIVQTGGGHYVYSAAHQFLSDIVSGDRLLTSIALSSISVANGVFDAADLTFSGTLSAAGGALVIYKDTGVAGTSPLVVYIDTGTNLPVPSGTVNPQVQWDNGASKIFAL